MLFTRNSLRKYPYFLAVIFILSSVQSLCADQREDLINREMDCVSLSMTQTDNLGWDNVCYTNPSGNYEYSYYNPEINQTVSKHNDSSGYSQFAKNDQDGSFLEDLSEFFNNESDVYDPDALKTTYEIGTEVYHFHYEEPELMKQNGFMYGVNGRVKVDFAKNDHIKSWSDVLKRVPNFTTFTFDGRFAKGEVDYESVSTGSAKGEKNYMFESRMTIGSTLPVQTDLNVTPYIGFGYRYLNNDSAGIQTTTGAYGYERESRYYYMPVGIESKKQLSEDWSYRLLLEYDFFFDGDQISHLDDVSTVYSSVRNDQNKGFGLKTGIKLIKENPNYDFYLEPFWNYWHLERSDFSSITCDNIPCAVGYEPKNRTSELGFKLGTRF